ncbi:MAG: tandem-95 repeat protein, partial [Aliishimia sp.]
MSLFKKFKVSDLALEPRTMFDAAFAVDIADQISAEDVQSFTSDLDQITPVHDNVKDGGKELYVIDSRVENADAIIASAAPGTLILRLDTAESGFAQIEAFAQENPELSAIHIFGHGGAGFLLLGDGLVTAQTMLDQQADSLKDLGDALGDDADILIYGCNFADGEAGRTAATIMAALTGAEIAASTDATGDVDAGGDWTLEFQTDAVETEAVAVAGFTALLAVEATDGIFTVQDSDTPAAGTITLSDDGAGVTTTNANTPRGVQSMVPQIWTYEETADVGESTIVIDISTFAGTIGTVAADFALVISDQADLSLPATTVLRASGFDEVNGLVYFHKVNLADGAYVGVATQTETDNISIDSVVVVDEEGVVDLNLVVQPALTDGGSLPDTFATSVGFRASNAGSTPTEFLIPAGTTNITITGSSSFNAFNGNNAQFEDDFQNMSVSIDLGTGQSSGYLAHIVDLGPNRNDQFSWSDVALGTGVLDGGTVQGNTGSNINPVFSVVDGRLQIVENTEFETAYLVEFASTLNSSANFLGSSAALVDIGDTDDVIVEIPAGVDYIKINQNDAAAGSNFRVEYKGYSSHFLDLATGEGSGSVMAQQGSGPNRTVTYGYDSYDFGGAAVTSIQSSTANVTGDTTSFAAANNDLTYYVNGDGDLVISRASGHANNFNSMFTVEFYDRLDVGSSADTMGSSSDSVLFDADPDSANAVLSFTAPEGATLGLLNLSMSGTDSSSTNENMGSGFVIVDLENGTTSGSMFNLRSSNNVDLLSWANVPEGTNMFSVANGSATGGEATSNHDTLSDFTDSYIANGAFEFTTNADGSTTVEFSTNSIDGPQSFRDYNAFANVQWLGSEPIKLTGLPEGGSFNIGELNTVTGDWEIDIDEAAVSGLIFTPPEHFSGNLPLTLNVSVGPEADEALIIQRPVLDLITFDTTEVTGDEDTEISLSAAVNPTFVDDDGSETVTSTLLSDIEIGHTVTDGTNTFTATAGSQSVDVSSWDDTALTYFAGDNINGVFTLSVVIDYQDTGAGQTVSGSATDTLTVTVVAVNDEPDAVDDQFILVSSATLVTALPGVLDNDSDVENDTLTVNTTPVSGPSHGVLTLNSDGSFTYVNSGDGATSDQFTYAVSDGNGGVSEATVVITISPAPISPPDAIDDMVTTDEETSVNIDVLANDLPNTGPIPIVQSVTQPTNGAVTINANGTIEYTPNDDFFSGVTDSFTYTLLDALGQTDTATVVVTVNNVQDVPTTLPDSASTPEDVFVNINVLANDNDVDGDTLTIESATSAQGSVTIETDGTLTFVPNTNFSGPATITYTINDGNGNSASSTVAVTVTAQPDAPDSADQTVTLDEDSVYAFVPSDFAFTDGDTGDTLQFIDFEAPSLGTLSLNGTPITAFPVRVTQTQIINGGLTYQPATDDAGLSYATMDFLVSDGQLSDTTANTITFDVTPIDDDIVLSGTDLPNQTLVDGETGVSITTAEAFTDVDSAVANYAFVGAPAGLQIDATTGVITSVAGGIDHLASDGSPYTVAVTATSADGSSATTSFLIAVTNPAPVSTPGGDFEFNDGDVISPIDVTTLFSDPDMDALTFTLESGSFPPDLEFDTNTGILSGTISNTASALVTYTATFRATDEQGRSTTSSVSFTINNPEPVLVMQIPNQNNFDGDEVIAAAGIDLGDFITDDDPLTFAVSGLPAGLSYDATSNIISGTLDTSASQGGVDGSYAISVIATDTQGRDTEANFTWNVVNLIPVIDTPIPDEAVQDSSTLTIPLSSVFSDPDMDGLTYTVTADNPALGTITVSPVGIITIDVASSASQTNGGIYLLTVTADDSEGGTTAELVQITVTNPPPVIETLIADQTNEDADTVSLDVSGNFADVDNDDVTYTATGLAALGLSIDANGLITGTIPPSTSQTSPFPITITATDADGGVGEYSFIWNITNPVPTAGTIPTQSAVDGQTVSFDAAAAAGFGDEDVLAYSLAGLPAG